MKKNFKVAFVGCGRVAHHYLKMIKQIRNINIQIDAVCDIEKKKAIKFSKKINSKPYFNLKKEFTSYTFNWYEHNERG